MTTAPTRTVELTTPEARLLIHALRNLAETTSLDVKVAQDLTRRISEAPVWG